MIGGLWLKSSIMTKRGIARGEAGRHHDLSIVAQGAFHYVYGPYAKLVLTIDPGDVVAAETEDALGGVIISEKDSPSAKRKFPYLNPQCGPIAVRGISKGDCLAVHIQAVETRGEQPAGTTCIIPEFGGLVRTASLSGVAIEQRATVTLQIDVDWAFAWPRLETENFLMTIGSARPLGDAACIAYREPVRCMSADYGFDEMDAYMLLSQAGRIRLGNTVDPKHTICASILKEYLV